MESLLPDTVPSPDRLPRVEPDPPETKQHPASTRHDCRFYEDDDFLCAEVARYVVEGLNDGQPVLLVATGAHREAIERHMAALGTSFDKACHGGSLTYRDAEDTLSRIMGDAGPDELRFQQVIGDLFARIWPGQPGAHLRIFGEMMDLLWRSGRSSAALALEDLWNALAERSDFELLCAYSMRTFEAAPHPERFEAVRAAHAHATAAEAPPAAPADPSRDLEIGLLLQRTRELEAELAHRRDLEAALLQALEDRTGAEQALLAARAQADDASRVKSDFLALMSHELRTPLNAILGYQDLLEHGVGGQLCAEQRAYLSRMRSCSHQLLRLIDQVLSFSRVETGAIELGRDVFSAYRLARETATMIEPGAQQRGLSLDFRGPQGEITLVTDSGTVRQILLNLLTNAIKFTEDGGIRFSVARRGDEVVFEVADTGIGIAAEDLERIFEPFVQVENPINRRFGGSGLGLAMSRDLARLLGGQLTVHSEPGWGSVFTLALPIAKLAVA